MTATVAENDLINTYLKRRKPWYEETDAVSLFYVRAASPEQNEVVGRGRRSLYVPAHIISTRQPSVSRDSLPSLGHPLFQTVASIPERRTRVRFAPPRSRLPSASITRLYDVVYMN